MWRSYRKIYLISMFPNFQEFTLASQPIVPSSGLCGIWIWKSGVSLLCRLQSFCVVRHSRQVSKCAFLSPHPAYCLLCNEAEETIQHLLAFSKGGGTICSRVFTRSIDMIWKPLSSCSWCGAAHLHTCYRPLNRSDTRLQTATRHLI